MKLPEMPCACGRHLILSGDDFPLVGAGAPEWIHQERHTHFSCQSRPEHGFWDPPKWAAHVHDLRPKATTAGVCVCPIKDLLSTGHNLGCVEFKRA